jgi:hypothetical protein
VAGLIKLNASAQSGTATVVIPVELSLTGGHGSATFLWDITAITGTWDIALQILLGSNALSIASLATITTTGLKRIPLTADFSAVQMAIPPPTQIVFTEAAAGSLTSSVLVLFGD